MNFICFKSSYIYGKTTFFVPRSVTRCHIFSFICNFGP